MKWYWLTGLLAVTPLLHLDSRADETVPADYFAEPTNLPYDEEVQTEKQETGWHWKEFRYTSLVYQDVPIRIHAIYAVPDNASATNKAPAILMTHGIFGYSHNEPYKTAIQMYAKGGYAVLFIDWYPDYAANWKPTKPNEAIPYTTFGKLDYLKPWVNYWLQGNDWKDSLPYQFALAAKRGVTWLQSRPEVDGDKIGATGASYGGIFSSMLAGIDPRIKAVNPCVYTAGFGKSEPSYNHLPEGWKEQEVASWRARFDSQVLLAKRSVPILYTVGSVDPTFLVTKAMTTFASMKEPKHILIGPNRGHDYWDIAQGILFFDHALKGKMQRPSIQSLLIKQDGARIAASAKVTGDAPCKVEFFFTSVFELDPDLGPDAVASDRWKWIAVEPKEESGGKYTVRWTPPVMRSMQLPERLYVWGTEDVVDPKILPRLGAASAEKMRGNVRVFVRATDNHGAMECSPLSEPVDHVDPPYAGSITMSMLPEFEGAAHIRTNTVVAIQPDAPAGQPMATFDVPLPTKAVGSHGYVLWNWRQKQPAPTLPTDGVATPTKRILPPFTDTVKNDSFEAGKNWGGNSWGGFTAFKINGVLDTLQQGRSWHGSIPPGLDSAEEITLEATDDQIHRLTVVMPAAFPMPAGYTNACNVRVSVRSPDGTAATVKYRHTVESDRVMQFRFKGRAIFRVQITSQPSSPYHTLVGPSALFLD